MQGRLLKIGSDIMLHRMDDMGRIKFISTRGEVERAALLSQMSWLSLIYDREAETACVGEF